MGYIGYVKQLIAAHADVNLAETQSGMTPLMLAAQTGNLEIKGGQGIHYRGNCCSDRNGKYIGSSHNARGYSASKKIISPRG